MSRIVPQRTVVKQELPSWVNLPELIAASNLPPEDSIVKTAAEENKYPTITHSYSCGNCRKVTRVSDPGLRAQAAQQTKESVNEFKFTCTACGGDLQPYSKSIGVIHSAITDHSRNVVVETDLSKQASTYNTYIDRHLTFKAINALENFAHKQGMFGARARYIKGERVAYGSGSRTGHIDQFECEIEWMYGLNQRARVTASIGIDPGGRYKFPRVFKTVAGVELPFEKEAVQSIEHEIAMPAAGRDLLPSDTPTFRRPDISRFRAVTSSTTDAWGNSVTLNDEGKNHSFNDQPAVIQKEDGTKEWYQNGKLHRVNGPAVVFADGDSDWYLNGELIGSAYNGFTQEQFEEYKQQHNITSSKIANTVQPNQAVYNMGKQFNVKTVTPGQGATLVDPVTNKETVIQQEYLNDLSTTPQPKNPNTNNPSSNGLVSSIVSSIVDNMFTLESVDKFSSMVENGEVWEKYHIASQKLAWFDGATYYDDHGNILPSVEASTSVSPAPTSQRVAHRQGNPNISQDSQRWSAIRKKIQAQKEKERIASLPAEPVDITKESRQVQALRDLGYDPYEGKEEGGRDSSHFFPMRSNEEVEVGMTEFPYGVKKENSTGSPTDKSKQKGYRIPFSEMDENQVKEREQFPTKDELHIKSLPVKELNKVEKSAVLQAVADIEGTEDVHPYESEVQFQSYKKLPPGYPEPPVIEEASGGVKEMVTKFNQVKSEIEELQTQITAIEKPLKAQIIENTKDLVDEMKSKKSTLQKYLKNLWDRLDTAKDKIAYYEDQIYANQQEDKLVAKPASLAEILDHLKLFEPEVHEKVAKVKALIEDPRIQEITSYKVVEYPVSKAQEPKLKSTSAIEDLYDWFMDAAEVIAEFDQLFEKE